MEPNEESEVRRWTAKRRVALVVELLRGDTTTAEAARKHGLTVAEVEEWKERFLSGAENSLRSKPLDDEALREAEVKKLKQKIGDLVMDIEILKEAAKPYMPNPTGRQTRDE
jgi:transposase-like protein